jgi:hypothetical protein
MPGSGTICRSLVAATRRHITPDDLQLLYFVVIRMDGFLTTGRRRAFESAIRALQPLGESQP